MSLIRDGANGAAASGIPHAELLVRFADALVAHDDAELALLRPELITALGAEGFLEAAATAANFQRMVRIADGTGIPQDAPVLFLGGDLVAALRLRDFGSAANTPEPGALRRFAFGLLRPFAPRLAVLAASWLERRSRSAPRPPR